jgi:predicted amidophosphoribosyltransferase
MSGPLVAADRCTLCGEPVFGGRPAHPCCVSWADEIAAGRLCPACVESRRAERSRKRRGRS